MSDIFNISFNKLVNFLRVWNTVAVGFSMMLAHNITRSIFKREIFEAEQMLKQEEIEHEMKKLKENEHKMKKLEHERLEELRKVIYQAFFFEQGIFKPEPFKWFSNKFRWFLSEEDIETMEHEAMDYAEGKKYPRISAWRWLGTSLLIRSYGRTVERVKKQFTRKPRVE